MDTGRTTISNWEKGVSYPLFLDFLKLAKLFGVSLDAMVQDPKLTAAASPGEVVLRRATRLQDSLTDAVATRDQLLEKLLTPERLEALLRLAEQEQKQSKK